MLILASVMMSIGMSRFFMVTLRRLVSELFDLFDDAATAERSVLSYIVVSMFLIAFTTLGMISN